jgi:hypothetical protein
VREAQVAKAQMDSARAGGVSWGFGEDAVAEPEDAGAAAPARRPPPPRPHAAAACRCCDAVLWGLQEWCKKEKGKEKKVVPPQPPW